MRSPTECAELAAGLQPRVLFLLTSGWRDYGPTVAMTDNDGQKIAEASAPFAEAGGLALIPVA
jgi:hypothetical protein